MRARTILCGKCGTPITEFEGKWIDEAGWEICHVSDLNVCHGPGMEVFAVLDWSDVKDRGRVCTVRWGRTAGEARALCGQEVVIDGRVYFVRGVETHAVRDGFTEGMIGLLVGATESGGTPRADRSPDPSGSAPPP